MNIHTLKQILRNLWLIAVITCSFAGLAPLLMPATASAASVGELCESANPDGSKGYVQADGHSCCPKPNMTPTACFYTKYVNPAIAFLSAAVGLAVAAAIIYGGIEYVTSAGDPQKAAAGQKRIIEALIGLVAYVLLYAVLVFLVPGGFLNVK